MPKSNTLTIKGFILRTSLLFSALGFMVIFWAASTAYQASVRHSAEQVAHTLANNTFLTMMQVMSQGWSKSQLEQHLSSLQRQQPNGYSTRIYASPTASIPPGLSTDIDAPVATPAAEIQQVFRSGQSSTLERGDEFLYFYPLVAQADCTTCHTQTAVGETLGVIEVRQRLAPLLNRANADLLLYLLAIAPFPILLSLLVIRFMDRRIRRSVTFLEDSIDKVKTVSDLTQMELRTTHLGFKELSDIFWRIDSLTRKMREVAVDKDLLEFEIRLLEKFVITSEVVRDWREYVCILLRDINQVIHAYTLFSIFKVDEEIFDLEIFWLYPPSEQTKQMMEHSVRRSLQQGTTFIDTSNLKVVHNIANRDGPLLELAAAEVEVQTKSLLVEAPKIGGIVGIGVHTDIVKDQTRVLVVESILSTLLNVVGSVKAIYKYTKDLEYYATRDPLTHLYNQRLFWELLEYEADRSQRHDYKFGLLIIDFDNFKTINDSHGHAFGDRFLQEFAQRLQIALRHGDVLARYGGDEFVIILPEAELEQASMIAERVLSQVRDIVLLAPSGDEVKATISIGMGIFPDHAGSTRDLFMFADNMMYKAKSLGKNQVCLPTSEDVLEVFRGLSEKSLLVQKAIEKRLIIPYFQPLMGMADGKLAAVEVLSRIDLGADGIMGAHEFIEIAESLGVIHQIDYIVMDKAFALAQQQAYEGMLFINLSPKSLLIGEFILQVKNLVETYQIAPERIVFEITERDTVKNLSLLEKFIANLKSVGFQLAIDDFGSGFSSFHYLKRFPIDFVKIEGEFIANAIHDGRDGAFVRSIAGLARELGAKTVAEYVESAEVLAYVQSVGIDLAQGYHIGRPGPQLPAWRQALLEAEEPLSLGDGI